MGGNLYLLALHLQKNISQPTCLTCCQGQGPFPERWLSNGTAYEFTTTPTYPPPPGLIEAFNTLTKDIDVLGLYYIGKDKGRKEPAPCKMVESTVGRSNILRPWVQADELCEKGRFIQTGWDLGSMNPVTCTCLVVILCDTRTTRLKGSHKGKASFLFFYFACSD